MRAPPRPVIIALAIASLAGCTEAPGRTGDMTAAQRHAPYPALIPARRITARVPAPSPEADTAADLDRRAARLRARAAGLSAPVIDDATRARMQTGVVR